MNEYLETVALLLEHIGMHPRIDSDHQLAAIIRSYEPGLDGELEREHMGWRPFICEKVSQ